jgi:hypothetical protein
MRRVDRWAINVTVCIALVTSSSTRLILGCEMSSTGLWRRGLLRKHISSSIYPS